MKLEFKPEDFKYARPKRVAVEDYWDWAADIANARLQELLKDAPTVYGPHHDPVANDGSWYFTLANLGQINKAKLVCIEEIK